MRWKQRFTSNEERKKLELKTTSIDSFRNLTHFGTVSLLHGQRLSRDENAESQALFLFSPLESMHSVKSPFLLHFLPSTVEISSFESWRLKMSPVQDTCFVTAHTLCKISLRKTYEKHGGKMEDTENPILWYFPLLLSFRRPLSSARVFSSFSSRECPCGKWRRPDPSRITFTTSIIRSLKSI